MKTNIKEGFKVSSVQMISLVLVLTVGVGSLYAMSQVQDLSSLENEFKLTAENIHNQKIRLCQIEQQIAIVKVKQHLSGEKQYENYDILTKKAIGEQLQCGVFQ
jgi:hypothetical protein